MTRPRGLRKAAGGGDPRDAMVKLAGAMARIGELQDGDNAGEALELSTSTNVLEIVKQPTWRELLVELIAAKQLDPWNIDVAEVADAYLARIREMQVLDLRIPANVILASAILLHFKADALLAEDEVCEEPKEPERSLVSDEGIPELAYKARGPRTRRVTLVELFAEIEKILSEPERVFERVEAQPLELQIPKQDMSARMEEVYQRALALKDADGVLLFSQLAACGSAGGSEGVLRSLLPLLHLVQDSKLAAWQEEVFGEIFVKVLV